MRYVYIFLAIAAGIVLTWKADLLNQYMSAPETLASKVGGGTSFYRLIGILTILAALVFLTGII